MKNIFLYLIIAASILGCQSEPKEKRVDTQIHLAHEPEQKKESEPKNKSIVSTCSDDYEHQTFTLGKGLVRVNSGRGEIAPIIELYNDSSLKEKYVSWNYYEQEKSEKPVCPKYFTLEPDVIQFVYIKETPRAYQVINGFDEIKYLAKSKVNVSANWQDHILNAFGIRRSTTEQDSDRPNQTIKKSPSETSETIKFPNGLEMLCPIEIKGDWVKVQYDCFYNQESNKYEGQPCNEFINKSTPAQLGWIKWREKNKILIDIFLMP